MSRDELLSGITIGLLILWVEAETGRGLLEVFINL